MTFASLLALLMMVGGSRADVPPPYEVYDVGASLSEGEPFPVVSDLVKGGPADKAGVKKGDGVIAIDGAYSKGGGPFYFFARRFGGPKGSVAEVVLLRDGYSVLTIKAKRTHRRG
jgi:C-terminal processing protease CtpA/Prc